MISDCQEFENRKVFNYLQTFILYLIIDCDISSKIYQFDGMVKSNILYYKASLNLHQFDLETLKCLLFIWFSYLINV